MKKILVILGPTATGKTDVALSLAKKFGGELISCDSRQVYQGLDIGTGKLPGKEVDVKKGKGFWEMDGVKVWMYDVVSPKTQYTVYDYAKDAAKIIEDIPQRGKLPIIVGGTGLYLKALLQGMPNLAIPVDPKLRGELEKLSLLELQNKLQELSPTRWENMASSDQKNKRRLLRSIELHIMYPYIISIENVECKIKNYDVLKIGLTAPRQVLYEKINSRVSDWLNDGILQEVEDLHEQGIKWPTFKRLGLEYAVISQFLQQKISHHEMVLKMQQEVRHYAKRQRTWFKREKDVLWFDVSLKNIFPGVEKEVKKWYHAGNDQKN